MNYVHASPEEMAHVIATEDVYVIQKIDLVNNIRSRNIYSCFHFLYNINIIKGGDEL